MNDAELLTIIARAERQSWIELDLSGKGIKTIPPEIANLANLTKLDLCFNQITAIPDAIANLANLTSLSLDSNQIKVIPDAIANLANLGELSLSNNPLPIPAKILYDYNNNPKGIIGFWLGREH